MAFTLRTSKADFSRLFMLDKIFDYPDPHGCFLIIAKTVVIYLFLILGLRFLGKRELGQMNIYDLVLIIVLGNSVQNAMMNGDNSLVGGLIAATVLLIYSQMRLKAPANYLQRKDGDDRYSG